MTFSTRRFAAPIAALLTLLAAGCDDRAQTPPSGDAAAGDRADSAPVSADTHRPIDRPDSATPAGGRAATKSDSISLEGTPEPRVMTLVTTDLYSTYYPAGEMIVDQSSSDEGTGLRFIANFAEVRNDDAFLHIFTPNDPAVGREEALEVLLGDNGIIRSNGWTFEKHTTKRCDWAPESYAIAGKKGTGHLIGFACVGEHRGRGFVVLAVYPEDYVEGMGPRIDYILRQLVWTDTGTTLGQRTTGGRRLDTEKLERL